MLSKNAIRILMGIRRPTRKLKANPAIVHRYTKNTIGGPKTPMRVSPISIPGTKGTAINSVYASEEIIIAACTVSSLLGRISKFNKSAIQPAATFTARISKTKHPKLSRIGQ